LENNFFLCSEMKKIIVAIDGFSSTGKSTLAKQLAKRLGYTYIDSGAMYRAITLYFLRHEIALTDKTQISNAIEKITLHFENNEICLNEENVEKEIRSMEISNLVSEVSALEAVRTFAVAQQQKIGKKKGLVMDGRDIGTTVFPHAELKIYLHANEKTRTQRRFDEMKVKNSLITLDEVRDNLKHRDLIDSTREISPLKKAADAIVLDNSELTMEEQLEISYKWVMERKQSNIKE
jgi:cytidylate kinase